MPQGVNTSASPVLTADGRLYFAGGGQSVVVPVGSLQNENGIDTSRDHGANIFNGTNSRWRLGFAPCLEVLVDLPTYVTPLRGAGPSGFMLPQR